MVGFPGDTTARACPAAQEGKKDASPEAAQRADDVDVKESVRSRVVSGSQTT